MNTTHILKKYPSQVPRYTSYPTAPHFYAMNADTHAKWLGNIAPDAPVSLYLHIPYCKKLCWFCGCNTRISQKYGPVETYLALLIREIRMVVDHFGKRLPVSHIHFGGGSPTILACEDFSQLMDVLHEQFEIQPNAEIAIEIDPRSVSEAKIAAYAKYGVNRVSVGVQDFDADVQKSINRFQPFSTVYEAVKLCREYGINDVSLDLIYGLPKQRLEGFQRTIDYALLFDANRISLFGYAHVPWKKKNMRLISEADLPDTDLRYALFEMASRRLIEAGYVSIGLDHFAKADDAMAIALRDRTLRRNFQGYTTDPSHTLLGFGASAVSSFPQGYVQNNSGIDAYEKAILAKALPTQRGFALGAEDRLRRAIIESLMCYFETDIAHLCREHGCSPITLNKAFLQLQEMQKDGLVAIDGLNVKVNPDVPQTVRLVCALFDSFFLPDKQLQHARVS